MITTDEEALAMIERCRWAISPQIGGGWVIETDDGADDPEVVELARTRGTLREALRMAACADARRVLAND